MGASEAAFFARPSTSLACSNLIRSFLATLASWRFLLATLASWRFLLAPWRFSLFPRSSIVEQESGGDSALALRSSRHIKLEARAADSLEVFDPDRVIPRLQGQ
jgi:hypothetical protein